MVQRKTPDKLGIPSETKKSYVKSDKPASSQHQDNRRKGGSDLKKKLKKSRSLKLLDFESLELSPEKKEKSRLNKAPAAGLCATPQKSSMIKTTEASPNYMKSTSSSNARTERSPVSSSRSSRTSCDGRNQNKRNSNNSKSSSPSGEKPVKTLTKRESLKPVRTLTKSFSMKSIKPLMKNSSGVSLNKNLNPRRATCSSTLKDSKFPNYLTIQPGGTESEGTSVAKVCPYTYCSLNGHHHAPLPPLKSFLSARRRLLKTQRSLRLRCLSPAGRKLSTKSKKKIDTGQKEFDGDYATLGEEIGLDFFVEIYAKPMEQIDEASTNDTDDKTKIDVSVNHEARDNFSSFGTDGAETEMANDGKASKSMPKISFEYILDQNSDFISTDMDISEHIQQVEVEETEYPPHTIQTEADLECCCIGTKSESTLLVETELDGSVAEASEMNWEEGKVVSQRVSDGPDSSNLTNGDVLQEALEGKIESSDADIVDSESYGGDLISEIDVSIDFRGEGSLTSLGISNEFSFTEDPSEDQKEISEEEDTEPDDFISSVIPKSSVEEPLGEVTEISEENNGVSLTTDYFIQGNFLLGDDELPCSAEVTFSNAEEEEHNTYSQDYALIDENLSPGSPDINEEVGAQLSEPEDGICEIEGQIVEAVDSKTNQTIATNDISLDQLPPTADVGVEAEEKEQVDQDSGENHNNESAQMHTEIEVSECAPMQEDDECGTVADNLLPLTQDHSHENQELPDKDQSEGMDLRISSSTHDEEHNDPESYKLISAETEFAEKIQVEDEVGTDATETCLAQSNGIGAQEKKTAKYARRDSHQQVTESCSNLKISIRHKEHIKESEEAQRKFNPRDPNYLPVEPDPEAEKVDLRQQMIDERKNSEEWMLDYALRKAVNELAPARKRRVALLVEAFETVTPQPKCESRIQHVLPAFVHTRPMQACI